MSRHDVTDREWNAIRKYLPKQRSGKRGRPWSDHRNVVNGILWVLGVGGSWRDVPVEYGKWQTITIVFVAGLPKGFGTESGRSSCARWISSRRLEGSCGVLMAA